ncbi:MAG: ABC-F family ATP-binding cassette domain-containing protein [Deltaproteobacteria bacterium]|nr:ABC-F family ATP-binding cassette domain-containing protein [Deltaproteobacteria bacterium]
MSAVAPILGIVDLRLAFGERVLFDGIDLTVLPGDKIGLIGDNGTGKSTLLKVIVGHERAQRGDVALRGGTRIGMLEQVPELDPTLTVRATLEQGLARVMATIAAYEAACVRMDPEADRFLPEIEALGGFDQAHRVEAIADRLRLGDTSRAVGVLSGGQKKRVALGRLVLAQPDLVLFDEPTNHLDVETVEWLEDWIADARAACIVVTHDRYFLDRAVTRMAELRAGRLSVYSGGYEGYLEARALEEERRATEGHKKLQLLKGELEWARRMPKARTTKSQARLDRVAALGSEVSELTKKSVVADFGFGAGTPRLAKSVAELEGATIGYPGAPPLCTNLDLRLARGQRLGVIGRNGAGKTSLLRTLAGEIPPLAGRLVVGPETRFAYFDQHRSELDDAATVFGTVTPEGNDTCYPGGGKPMHAAAWLARFAFDARHFQMPVGSLSGGERNRLALARFLLQPANVLLFDEPTNDLDLQTLHVLEEAILAFDGTVVVVSHDRSFLDRVATAILAFEGDDDGTAAGTHVHFQPGDWTTYRRLRVPELEARREALAQAGRAAREAARAGLSDGREAGDRAARKAADKAAKALQALEVRIHATEARIAELEAALSEPSVWAGDGARGRGLAADKSKLEAELEAMYGEYMA